MAQAIFIQTGKTVDYTNKTTVDIGYGDIVPLVTRIGVAAETIPKDATGSLNVVGIYEVPAVNDMAFLVGDQVYWDASGGKVTKTATSNTPAGWCTEAKASAGTTARVKIGG